MSHVLPFYHIITVKAARLAWDAPSYPDTPFPFSSLTLPIVFSGIFSSKFVDSIRLYAHGMFALFSGCRRVDVETSLLSSQNCTRAHKAFSLIRRRKHAAGHKG